MFPLLHQKRGLSGPYLVPPRTPTDATPTEEHTSTARGLQGRPPDTGQPSPALEDWEGESPQQPACVIWAWWGQWGG